VNEIEPYPVKIINWGYWGSVGVASTDNYRKLMSSQGIIPITPEEGMESVIRVLSYPIDQVIPVKIDEQFSTKTVKTGEVIYSKAYKRPQSKNEYIITNPKQLLKQIISEQSKISEENIDDDISFRELGMDSISLLIFAKIIQERMGFLLDPAILLEYPTINSLNSYLEKNNFGDTDKLLSSQSFLGYQKNDKPQVVEGVNNSRKIIETSKIKAQIEQSKTLLSSYWSLAILLYFQENGIFCDDQSVSKEQVVKILDMLPRYNYMLEALINFLKNAQLITEENDLFKLTDKGGSHDTKSDIFNLNQRFQLIMRVAPEKEQYFSLFNLCKEHYKKFMTGKDKPEEILLKGGPANQIKCIYAAEEDLLNNITSELLEIYGNVSPEWKSTGLRILELGTGTLALTKSILLALDGKVSKVEYLYPKINDFFNKITEGLCRHYPFVQFTGIDWQLNGNNPLHGKFDIVVIKYPMHSLKQIVYGVKDIIDDNTLIFLGEPFETDYFPLTFGFLDEKFLYRSALGKKEFEEATGGWMSVLTEEGYYFKELLGCWLTVATKEPATKLRNVMEYLEKRIIEGPPSASNINYRDIVLNDHYRKKIYYSSETDHIYEIITCGQGEHEPAIFLTALAFNCNIWKYQVDEFRNKYQIFMPHLPGHEGSKFKGKSFTFEELADDLAEILDHLKISRVNLVSWCMAGNIGQLFAHRHPNRLKTLTLVCTTPADARLRGINSEDLIRYSKNPLITYELEFKHIYGRDYYNNKSIRDCLDIIRCSHCKVESKAVICHVRNMFNFNSMKWLKNLHIPTLVIAGKWDVAFPPDQVKLIHQGIARSFFYEFEGGGHMPFLNEHKLFNKILQKFWNEQKINATLI
jgi:pimeloyl-ACP methyl ester carboxylesterase/acyl carrier protein/phospholipid N-methyltransferase